MRRFAAMLLVAVAVAAPARAEDKAECAAASLNGQKMQDQGKYLDARREFVACSHAACPPLLQKDCGDWLADLEQRTPSVVLGLRDASGKDVAEARVLVDGTLLTERLDGRPVAIDPGDHVFQWQLPDGRSAQQHVVIQAGEKNRVLAARLEGPPETARTTGTSGSRIASYVLGGVAVGAFTSFAILGLSGRSDVDHLRSTCAPYCEQSQLDAAKTKLIVADVSLVTGIVSLGVAAVLFFILPSRTRTAWLLTR